MEKNILIKVCGLAEAENITSVITCNPDFLGFIFYPASPRYVVNKIAPEFVASISGIKKVGVFVNEKEIVVLDIVSRYGLDYVQLHGDESPEYCESIARHVPVIKAFRLNHAFNFSKLMPYQAFCKYFLFDTKTEKYGGSGEKFNWNKLAEYTLPKPFFLSGGIDGSMAKEITDLQNKHLALMAVDINSCFEQKPGVKDVLKIKQFKTELREHETFSK